MGEGGSNREKNRNDKRCSAQRTREYVNEPLETDTNLKLENVGSGSGNKKRRRNTKLADWIVSEKHGSL
jgi:hypothetical protein